MQSFWGNINNFGTTIVYSIVYPIWSIKHCNNRDKPKQYMSDFFDNKDNDTIHLPITSSEPNSFDNELTDEECSSMPILPLRDVVLFPGSRLEVRVGRESSLKVVKEAFAKGKQIATIAQKDVSVEHPKFNDLNNFGVIAKVINIIKYEDHVVRVILQGGDKFELTSVNATKPYLKGSIKLIKDLLPREDDKKFDVIISEIKDMMSKYISMTAEDRIGMTISISNKQSKEFVVNHLCTHIETSLDKRIDMLNELVLKNRALKLLKILTDISIRIDLLTEIQKKTREELSNQQRDHFIQQQIRILQAELGEGVSETDPDIAKIIKRANNNSWSKEVRDQFDKEFRKLQRLHPQSPDYSIQYNYVETLSLLPWGVYTKDNFDLKNAKRQLDKDHCGLDKVKERILEHIAVLKLRGDMNAPILCLYGPPGVGKTSLGKSIADALKRKYVRISLGGLHDESEIRGHRRTYLGAIPGRIMQGIQKADSSNPVFVLDEIDKIGVDFKGDPSSALLEVLDPEQNSAFHDNYINIDYDLSKVMFIATANNLSTISQPLLDRMELIDVSGYILDEKIEIARRHLIPKQIEAHGLKKGDITIPKNTISKIITDYTRESGVRNLDKRLAKIMRVIACKKGEELEYNKRINPDDLKDYLGIKSNSHDAYEDNDTAGVVTGLAWTSVGGEILFIESSLNRGKAGDISLTGNLGAVMKESAIIALHYVKSKADKLKIPYEVFDKWRLHIHVPEGAIPKDGPSAGVTMVTSIASTFTQRKIKPHLAMTGEITLRGRVLPVGGIKEKILAAKRAGIKEIILCEANRKDIEDIPEAYLKGLEFHYVKTIMDVLDIALLDTKVNDPIELNYTEEK